MARRAYGLSQTKLIFRWSMMLTPKYSVASIMDHLKGMSSLMIFGRHVILKYKFGNRRFWAEGCAKCSAVRLNLSRSWTDPPNAVWAYRC